ncbi:hypothetical protein R6Q57_010503 [Mikania cordata]
MGSRYAILGRYDILHIEDLAAGTNPAAAPAYTAAARAQLAARSYQRAADATSGSVGRSDLVAGACRA